MVADFKREMKPTSNVALQGQGCWPFGYQCAVCKVWLNLSLSVSQPFYVKYHAKAMASFHQINAFEQDGFLLVDLCGSDDGGSINDFLIQNMRKSGEALDQVKQKHR